MEHCLEQQLSLHLKNFNNKIKVLNQTGAKDLTLTAVEARNIHAEIFELLTQIQELAKVKKEQSNEVITVQLGGSKF
jgi:hypothetical protein